MAPPEQPKATRKLQRSPTKSIAAKGRLTPATTKKRAFANITIMKKIERIPLKMNNTNEVSQTAVEKPKVTTPKSKQKPADLPGSVIKSAKKSSWKRRPKPAHSGVPVPEKMKQLIQKQFQGLDDSL